MRKAFPGGVLAVMLVLGVGTPAAAQDAPPSTATQSVTLEVTKIAKLTLGGTISLVIDEANGAVDGLEVVEAAGTYNRVNNYTPAKITAQIDQALTAGFTLEVQLAADAGSYVDVSTATAAVDVLTGMARGATSGGTLNYRFSATPAAGVLASNNRTITFTLTE